MQSLAQSSFDAWLKFYKPDENTPNAVVSYYGKGAQLALGLDLKLRLETEGRVSLDTVMQAAWQRYGRDDRPVPENALASLAARDLGPGSGRFLRISISKPRRMRPGPIISAISAFARSPSRRPTMLRSCADAWG